MDVLEVQGLCKRYPSFTLDQVSFSVGRGRIMGFIGRNGAGKTTTQKALLNFVHRDAGDIRFFGLPFDQNERAVKERISFVSGGVDFYPQKKLRDITAVTRRFYQNWDEEAYQAYMNRFALISSKTPEQLSAGMRVKYLLALALSHHAELLILDEPTSGLDPVSRAELLDEFLRLTGEGVTVFFSTHITSDLEQCADDITYIKGGKVVACEKLKTFVEGYRALNLTESMLAQPLQSSLIGLRRVRNEYTALIALKDAQRLGMAGRAATLEDIMVHFEREEAQ